MDNMLVLINEILIETSRVNFFVKLDTSFSDINLNSIEFIRLLVACEEKFCIQFDDEDLVVDKYTIMNDLISIITDKIDKKSVF